MIESPDHITDTRSDTPTDGAEAATPGPALRLAAITGLRASRGRAAMAHPLTRRLVWGLVAIVFYQSGLVFTTWLLEPAQFMGGVDWLWLLAFPGLLPGFFLVNRHLGCASAQCPARQRTTEPEPGGHAPSAPERMPGV